MSASEKTLELNICSQIYHKLTNCGLNVEWTGLTQKEEAKKGFDASTHINGVFFAFQFKKCLSILQGKRKGQYRFKAPDRQMENLITFYRKEVIQKGGRIFYALPAYAQPQKDCLKDTWLLDIADLDIEERRGVIPISHGRKGEYHNIYVNTVTKKAKICSEPFTRNVQTIKDFLRTSEGIRPEDAISLWQKDHKREGESKEYCKDSNLSNKGILFDNHAFGCLVSLC